MATTEPRIGRVVRRKEDPQLIRGEARFTDDITPRGTLHLAMVRSPFAHADIRGIDTTAAKAHPGVTAVYTYADIKDDLPGAMVCAWPIVDDIKIPQVFAIEGTRVRYAGQIVAVVVAGSRAAAQDAAELVDVDYEPLPVVIDPEEAMADGAPQLYDDVPNNLTYRWSFLEHSPVPGAGDPDPVIAAAPVVVTERYRLERLVPNAMEPRSILVEPNVSQGEFTVTSSTQIPHIVRTVLTLMTGVPEAKLRIIAPAVGGGFGSKLQVYPEDAICLVVSRKLGRVVKWTADRTEEYVSVHHGRDQWQEVTLAADESGKLKAVKVKIVAGMGAHHLLLTPGIPMLGAWLFGGCYEAEAYGVEILGVFTNNTPTDAYRGAGRPEATYAIERAMDALARRVGKDPTELRRMNMIPTSAFPNHTIMSGLTVDSGDYTGSLDILLRELDYEGLRAEQQRLRDSGSPVQLGIGFSTWIEMCGLAPSRVAGALKLVCGLWESATVKVMPTGTVQVMIGVTAHGQSHATTFSQLLADQLGVDFEDVEIIAGDTKLAPFGMDTYGSRSLSVGGIAMHNAGEKIIAKSRAIAAHTLECAEEDLEYSGGTFTVRGTDKTMHVKEAAFAAWTAHNLPDGMEPGLEATYVYDPPNFSWPGGAHACVTEVDTQTGRVKIRRYLAVDDCGVRINPQIVDGQVHGGVAQGIAEALFEGAQYDEGGNLLTGTMTTYMVPTAADLPNIEVMANDNAPSPTNPLGVKGIGEAGTIASPPAVINSVVDALSHLGVTNVERPATPERVWRAIQEAAK
ncbi:MAG: molybdopterin cofactor-binding domain-containing protein [Thermoleophilia bacterium]